MIRNLRYALFGAVLIALSACAQQSSLPATSPGGRWVGGHNALHFRGLGFLELKKNRSLALYAHQPDGHQAPTIYTALGASDAVGIGASVPCGISTSTNPACPGGTGYVSRIATLLSKTGRSVALRDLGISGAVIGPDIKALGNRYGTLSTDSCLPRSSSSDAILADLLTNELPDLPTNTGYVSIFAGANDVMALAGALGCGAGGSTSKTKQAFVTTEATAFARDYARIIEAVRSTSPAAHIVVANLPNLAGSPVGLRQSATARQALQALSVAFDGAIDRLVTEGVSVVDLLCDPQSYISTNYSSDGFHPNDAGYALFASLMQPLLVRDTPTRLSPTCAQAAQVSPRNQQKP